MAPERGFALILVKVEKLRFILRISWIPAFAGMTEALQRPSAVSFPRRRESKGELHRMQLLILSKYNVDNCPFEAG